MVELVHENFLSNAWDQIYSDLMQREVQYGLMATPTAGELFDKFAEPYTLGGNRCIADMRIISILRYHP
jgi:hypothetical protein